MRCDGALPCELETALIRQARLAEVAPAGGDGDVGWRWGGVGLEVGGGELEG